jgi:hypothetical protein
MDLGGMARRQAFVGGELALLSMDRSSRPVNYPYLSFLLDLVVARPLIGGCVRAEGLPAATL